MNVKYFYKRRTTDSQNREVNSNMDDEEFKKKLDRIIAIIEEIEYQALKAAKEEQRAAGEHVIGSEISDLVTEHR